uniref:Uncharacterized protein n=1 Tax=Peronospora matthiolae TaxID=2874970 RepID=A0AAV1U9Z9_9STRA
MASFLLGDEYASSSSSSDEEVSRDIPPKAKASLPATATADIHLLPSVDELFFGNPSSVLTATPLRSSAAPKALSIKRKNEQMHPPAKKAVKKTALGNAFYKSQIAPFTPPQLRRPNISTEDRSSWNTLRTLAWQKKAKDARPSS